MSYMKIKLSGIYCIKHPETELLYIGKSLDIFSRWSSHYTNLYINKHSSTRLLELFNTHPVTEFQFSVLEYCSKTDFKKEHNYKGKELNKQFNKYLHSRERYHMSLYSSQLALNKNNKQFKEST